MDSTSWKQKTEYAIMPKATVKTVAFSIERGADMARKSRKPQKIAANYKPSPITVGYVRISNADKERSSSIENQKLIIENWGRVHQTPILDYYIDNGVSGKGFERPAFQKMLEDILKGKIECVVVKDLSRLGRNFIGTGYYIEMFFPTHGVRFVSVNDQFDTIDGIANQEHPASSRMTVPIKNLLNEQVLNEIKKNVEVTLDMKAKQGLFIGPRAPFGYRKEEDNNDQLVPDPAAAVVVRKIFDLASNGTGVTGIVRYLNERDIPTPIQYARSNGLTGDYNDGNGSWNSRSVKYILTNRTYTGVLIQGKEKRVVESTHEPIVDTEVFENIQKVFQAKSFNLGEQGGKSSENILKGKVICGCCGGKMQRKRGSDHADWYFFTCITKNRLGAGKCIGMYVREEDVFQVIYAQLKQYVKEHFIADAEYKRTIRELNAQVIQTAQCYQQAMEYLCQQYEKYVFGEIDKAEFFAAKPARNEASAALDEAKAKKSTYEERYKAFRKLLSASYREIPLDEIMPYINEVVVDSGRKIMVKWNK